MQQREDGTIEKILDPERVNRARLRIRARHWLVARLLPKKFGDRPERTAPQDGNSDMAEVLKALRGSCTVAALDRNHCSFGFRDTIRGRLLNGECDEHRDSELAHGMSPRVGRRVCRNTPH